MMNSRLAINRTVALRAFLPLAPPPPPPHTSSHTTQQIVSDLFAKRNRFTLTRYHFYDRKFSLLEDIFRSDYKAA